MSARKRHQPDVPFSENEYLNSVPVAFGSKPSVPQNPLLKSTTGRVTTSSMFRKVCGTACALGTAYAFGHFGLSYAWLLLGLSAWAVKEYHSQSKFERIQSTRAAASDEKAAILARLEDLPAWVTFPDTERVEWLNKMLKQFWPFINDYLIDLIKETIEPSLKDSLPSYIKSFRFEKIKLGDLPPRVGGIKVYTSKVARNEIVLDVELLYAGDCKFEISVKGLKAGLEDLQALDFNLTNMANLLDIPGLSNILRSSLTDIVCSMAVLPNKYYIPVLEDIDSKHLKFIIPAGVLRINVLGAKELVRADVGMLGLGKSDPYTILSVGAQVFKTPYISNTINPKWNFFCEALVDQLHGQSVGIEVMDHDQGNKDDFLGRATLPIYPLAAKGLSDLWIRLEQIESGHLHLETQWLALSEDPLDFKEAEADIDKLNAKKFNLSTALLLVYVDAAQNLPDVSRASGEPSAQVLLTLANEKRQTYVCKNSSNPIWEESFHFFCRQPQNLSLTVQVSDGKTEKSLGYISIPVARLINEPGMKIEEPFDLKASGNQSKITLCLLLRVLKPIKGRPESDKGLSPKTGQRQPTSTSPKGSPIHRNSPDTLPLAGVGEIKNKGSPKISPPSLEEMVQSTITPIIDTADLNTELLIEFKDDDPPEESNVGQQALEALSMTDHALATSPSDMEGVGRIQLTLRHSTHKNRLFVVIHKALDLPRHDEDDPDPYVKLYLVSDKTKDAKQKTQVVKNNCNPVYDEQHFGFPERKKPFPGKWRIIQWCRGRSCTRALKLRGSKGKSEKLPIMSHVFEFDGLKQGLTGQCLEVSVVSKNGGSVFARGHVLGKVLVPLEHLEPNKPVTDWYTLEPKED